MEQVEIAEQANRQNPPAPNPDQTPMRRDSSSDPIEVFLSGGRLQINANIGRSGITKLKQMLDKYEEILNLEDDTKEAPSD